MSDNTSAIAATSAYICNKCARTFRSWMGQCPGCASFGTVARVSSMLRINAGAVADLAVSIPAGPSKNEPGESHAAPAPLAPKTSRGASIHAPEPVEARRLATPATPSVPVSITSVDDKIEQRLTTLLEPLDRVLGGGLVVGSVVLIAGEPGGGKSTCIAQALRGLVNDRCVLYATGEESIAQAAMRARRIKATHDNIKIVAESDVDAILAHARALRPSVLVVDSISCLTTQDLGSIAGSVPQVKECAARLNAFAKGTGTATILIGHVTRGDVIAGPRTLDHLVDVVLQLYVSDDFPNMRFLRAQKNRFGDASEIGAFEMTALGMIPSFAEIDPELAEGIIPVAQELLNRYRELGGVVDEGLRDRIAGRLACDEALQ